MGTPVWCGGDEPQIGDLELAESLDQHLLQLAPALRVVVEWCVRDISGGVAAAEHVGDVVLHAWVGQEVGIHGVVVGPVGGVCHEFVGAGHLLGVYGVDGGVDVFDQAVEGVDVVAVDEEFGFAGVDAEHEVAPGGGACEVVVIVFDEPAQEGFLAVEGEDFAEFSEEYRLSAEVGAQGVDGAAVDGNFDGVDSCCSPRGVVVRVDLSASSLAICSSASRAA